MTFWFYKIQLAGKDFLFIDLDREAHKNIQLDERGRGELAELILDRRCGVGGDGLVLFQREQESLGTAGLSHQHPTSLSLIHYTNGGKRSPLPLDGLFCAARLAFDMGLANHATISLTNEGKAYRLTAVDSRTFQLYPPLPEQEHRTCIIDGKPFEAFLCRGQARYTAMIAPLTGPRGSTQRIKQALVAMSKGTIPVLIRPIHRELVRYVAPERADRIETGVVAALLAYQHNLVEKEHILEWRGRGGAVSYATFPAIPPNRSPLSLSVLGPATLIDRGRFWAEHQETGQLAIAGIAEYVFEGSFDL